MIAALLSIIIAYLIGSISSSCLVGYLAGRVDMRKEPDGRVSASAVYHKVGLFPFCCVVFLDICLAIIAVVVARLLTGSHDVMLLAGLTTVAGHNWSAFIKFKGGLGATAICGVLIIIVSWQIIYGIIVGSIILLLTHKPGLSTALGILSISGSMLFIYGTGIIALYPVALFSLMLVKKVQVARQAILGEAWMEKG